MTTTKALKSDAARCNARMVQARRPAPGEVKRGDPVNGCMTALLSKARGREFTTSDARHWTGHDEWRVRYAIDRMIDAGMIRCVATINGSRLFREVGAKK